MNLHCGPRSFAAKMVAVMLVLGGCKSGNQANNPPQSGSPIGSAVQPPQNLQQPPGGSNSGPVSGSSLGSGAPAPQAPPPPAVVELPAGTTLRIRLDQDLGSKISQPGDKFDATIADDVIVNGQTVIAKGARAEGMVIDAKPLGHLKGGALLELRLERVHTNWGSYAVATNTITRAEKGKGKRTAEFAGGGGIVGALVGGIAGHGKGALIGGVVGGGAGTAGSAFTGNKEIVLPAETVLTFHLNHPVHITEQQK
jgi:hypothetical protein